ncbi:MAG: hypothetical protein HY377_02380 [Candidatus Blackburnbacteria bacterium]|nr:hypothetical protein [Candidatus Blackburnbacteria bacterium]
MKTILTVIIFAVAFAFIEAAVVVYLRHLVGFTPPPVGKDEIAVILPGIAFLKSNAAVKIVGSQAMLYIEMIREAATLVVLVSVAALAGKRLGEGLAYFFLAFGIWDIFYYVFLRLTLGWPRTLSDLDVLFLLPVPWVGPVFVPILISAILILSSLVYLNRRQALLKGREE